MPWVDNNAWILAACGAVLMTLQSLYHAIYPPETLRSKRVWLGVSMFLGALTITFTIWAQVHANRETVEEQKKTEQGVSGIKTDIEAIASSLGVKISEGGSIGGNIAELKTEIDKLKMAVSPMILTGAQASSLKKFLIDNNVHPTNLAVFATCGNNSQRYASLLTVVLRSVGLVVLNPRHTCAPDNDYSEHGLVMLLPRPTRPSAVASLMMAALNTAQIPFKVSTHPTSDEKGDDVAFLVVGQ